MKTHRLAGTGRSNRPTTVGSNIILPSSPWAVRSAKSSQCLSVNGDGLGILGSRAEAVSDMVGQGCAVSQLIICRIYGTPNCIPGLTLHSG